MKTKSKTANIKIKKSKLQKTNLNNDLILSSDALIVGRRTKKNYINGDSEKQPYTYKENFFKFLLETTCHGLPFVGNRKISYFERFFFIGVTLSVLCVALTFIMDVYHTWSKTPVVFQLSNNPTKVTDFPFPAITICNKNQAYKSKVKSLNNDSIEYGILQMLCTRYEEINFKKMTYVPEDGDIFKTFNDTIMRISQPCDRLIIQCSSDSKEVDCSEMFKPILTDEGLCCTYNLLHPKFLHRNYSDSSENTLPRPGESVPVEWDTEKGYPNELPEKFYPEPVPGSGIQKGLTVTLDVELDEYYCSSTDGSGIKFHVHSPAETPLIKEIGFTVGTAVDLRVLLTPKYIVTADNVRNVDVNVRQCLYNDEFNLTYYHTYSMRNGQTECMSNKFYKNCGCVPYYVPRINEEVRYCQLIEMGCIYDFLNDPAYDNDELECYDFLPSCFDVDYVPMVFLAEIYHSSDNFTTLYKQRLLTPEYVSENLITMNFFFDEEYYYSLLRRKFVDTTTYLSKTGGLVALFLGMSSITFVEIFYFFFLRYFLMKLQERRNKIVNVTPK